MSLFDDINLLLRDHTGYTGDGQGGRGDLPVGDRSTARWTPDMRAFRELLKAMAQAQGDPGALQDILDQMAEKSPLAATPRMFASVDAAVAAGQESLPDTVGHVLIRDGDWIEVRGPGQRQDELFATYPWWGLLFRVPSQALLDAKADQADLDARIPQYEASAAMVPVVVTDSGQVALWLTGGDIDGRGMARHLRQEAVKDIVSRVPHGAVVPLVTAGDRVIAWLDAKGRFRAFGLPVSDAALPAQPRLQPVGSTVPVATDGRTLHRMRRKLSLARAGVAGAKLRIAMTGDSWSEMVNIPSMLADLIGVKTASAAGSFIQANNGSLWAGGSLTASAGWTRQDASTNSDWPYGTGPDGQNYHTTGDGETITITPLDAVSARIYTRKWGASWTYSVNGGAPVSVTEADADGELTATEIVGLSTGFNSLTITKTGGDGRLVFCGVMNVRHTPIEIAKLGNGGLTGYRMRDYAPLVGDVWADIDPDLVIINLGTNDYRNAYSTVATYIEGLTAFITMIRAWVPDVGILIVVPPQSDGAAVTPLSAYRDAAYRLAIENGCEFLNLLDSWGPYGGGLWADALHLNEAGSLAYADQIYSHFIGV